MPGDSTIPVHQFRDEFVQSLQILEPSLFRVVVNKMLGMIEPGKINGHDRRQFDRHTRLDTVVVFIKRFNGLPKRIFIDRLTMVPLIVPERIEIRCMRPFAASARNHVVNDETISPILRHIFVQRLHPIADVVGQKILFKLHLHRIDMIFRIVARHLPIPEE